MLAGGFNRPIVSLGGKRAHSLMPDCPRVDRNNGFFFASRSNVLTDNVTVRFVGAVRFQTGLLFISHFFSEITSDLCTKFCLFSFNICQMIKMCKANIPAASTFFSSSSSFFDFPPPPSQFWPSSFLIIYFPTCAYLFLYFSHFFFLTPF